MQSQTSQHARCTGSAPNLIFILQNNSYPGFIARYLCWYGVQFNRHFRDVPKPVPIHVWSSGHFLAFSSLVLKFFTEIVPQGVSKDVPKPHPIYEMSIKLPLTLCCMHCWSRGGLGSNATISPSEPLTHKPTEPIRERGELSIANRLLPYAPQKSPKLQGWAKESAPGLVLPLLPQLA